jgi:hypothetical protein
VASVSALAMLSFICPRCQYPANELFYGPCTVCVGQLRAGQVLDQRAAETQDYIPKMNVTPNAVATKE